MLLLASDAAGPIGYLIALAGSGGLLGAALGFIKLRGDRDSQAVSQAEGAMETMQALNRSLESALERANERADHYKRLMEAALAELEQIRQRWGPFPVDDGPAESRP